MASVCLLGGRSRCGLLEQLTNCGGKRLFFLGPREQVLDQVH